MKNEPTALQLRTVDSGRYQLLTTLGEGGMGLVYLAHDTTLGRDLALKTLRSHAPEEVYRLKKEFRSLARLSHPNLVQLYDLVVLDDQCFFTMELVDGVDIVRFVRGGASAEDEGTGVVDYDRLRASFYQLAAGLQALHACGTIHRDIKPANILAEPSGRVVLLDFGLASSLASDVSQRSRAENFAGTLAYMSPEQVAGGEVSAAADWYSVGLVLYECLTGRNPFEGPALLSAVDRTRREPAPPHTIAPETPADLDDLAVDLLRLAPEQRPSGAQVLERLQPHPVRRPPAGAAVSLPGEQVPFVGRADELAALRRAFDGARAGLLTVCISGVSGMGKTALIERFLSSLATADDALVLRARCHPQESVPFNAIDGAIDDLTRFLAHRAEDELSSLLVPNVGAIARTFPVLSRIPTVGDRVAAEDYGREPQEVRRRAFRSLRELLKRIAERQPLVLWIDDLQWSDLDSIALLRALCAWPDAPRLLLLLSFRGGDEQAPALRSLLDPDEELAGGASPPQRLELTGLPELDARELARQIFDAEGRPTNETALAAIVRESGGNAFFACELARSFAVHGVSDTDLHAGSLLARRVADLTPLDQRLLELVAVAGAPIAEELVYKVAGSDEAVGRALARLRADRLLRAAVVDRTPALAAYHDRVRETVVQRLSADSYRSLHRELAAGLEALPHPDPLRLVDHYFEAHDLGRASTHAIVSAERAFAGLAFEQAARLYRRALELNASASPRWELQARLGETLANLGHGRDAGAAFLAAARELALLAPSDPEVSRLKRLAAEQYLRSGDYGDGLQVLRDVLHGVGLPYIESANRVIFSLILNRARLWLRQVGGTAHARPRGDAATAERLEVCWAAGLGLGVADSLRAAEYQVRHALLAHGSGAVGHEARALAIEGLLMTWEGGRRKRRRAARLRVEGERLARASGDPNVEAYGMVLRCVGAFFERRLHEAVGLAERAEAFCRDRCVAVAWELANVLTIAVSARLLLGDLRTIGELVHTALREARERNDQYCLLMLRAGYCNLVWLVADEVDTAQRQVRAALAQPFPASFTWPVYQGALAETHIDLYRGDAVAAERRMQRAWRALRAGSMLRFQTVRIELRELRARSAILAAAAPDCDPGERQRLLRRASHEARRIAAEDIPWAIPFAEALRGEVVALQGDAHSARALVERAALGFEHLGFGLHAAAARYQLAPLLAGPSAGRQRGEQAAWMRDQGVRNPARMAAMLFPWAPAA